MQSIFAYWGKASPREQGPSHHLLPFHALDVAAVADALLERDQALLSRFSALSGFTPASVRRYLPYLIALHDLGKFSEAFQDQVPELVALLQGERPPRGHKLRHDSLGFLLWREWTRRNPSPHEAHLLQALASVSTPSGSLNRSDTEEVLRPWMAAVLGHHGKPPEHGSIGASFFAMGPAGPERSRRDAADFALAMRDLFAPDHLEALTDDVERLIDATKRSSWWLAGFTILCDWLGSDSAHFVYADEEMPLPEYWALARRRAQQAVSASGLSASRPRPFAGIAGVSEVAAREPTPLQAVAERTALAEGPQLFILEDLTGSGKTEAALVLAHRLMAAGHADGLFFALPTMATANAMDGRVGPLLERLFQGEPSYVLAHSGPRLTSIDRLRLGGDSPGINYGRHEETASRAACAWLADNRKKALLAELGVGTIDQAFLAVLQSKHAALRLFGLTRRVLIVDEVHACDAYMQRILCGLLQAHAALGGSAVLLSATLPLGQRQQLLKAFTAGLDAPPPVASSTGYPLLTACAAGRLEEVQVAPRRGSPRDVPVERVGSREEAAAQIIRAAREGQAVCWVRNTVADAVEAYEALAAELGAERITLFHARYALGDRLRIEQDVVARFGTRGTPEQRHGRVVVATQVVEQSLDIDFDLMVTDLCPIDLVIQRAGRLQRHERARPPGARLRLLVLAPEWSKEPPPGWLGGDFRRTAMVYRDPGILWRTARALHQSRCLALPVGARALVEGVYSDEEVPASLEARSAAAMGAGLAQASVAQTSILKLDLGYVREGQDWSDEASTPTRLGEPTTTVRLARLGDGAVTGERAWESDAREHLRWPLSQVSVARRLISGGHPDDEAACRDLEETQPFVGPDTCTVILREEAEGRWVGRALAERARDGSISTVSVQVTYSRQRGLDVAEGA